VGEAQVRGALALAREQRFGLAVQATVQPNPALELHDVVQVYDGASPASGYPATVCRVSELHLVW
jgi:hypothetical protein